jgi:hypothetical protein
MRHRSGTPTRALRGAHARKPYEGTSLSRWRRRVPMILVAVGVVCLGPSRTQTAEPEGRQHSETRSLQQFSRPLLMPSRPRSGSGNRAREARARLAELADALAALERKASPANAATVLSLRQRLARAVSDLRGNSSDRRARGGFETIERQVRSLFQDVDAAAIDPIGQRARIGVARARIAGALAPPPDTHGQVLTMSLPVQIEAQR